MILLDRSYSMAYGDRWTRAVSAARSAIAGLGANDRASLVLFDGTAVAATEPTADRAILTTALDAAKPGAGVTRYEPAFKLAQRVLADSRLPRREVMLISDFQRIGWDGRDSPSLPSGTDDHQGRPRGREDIERCRDGRGLPPRLRGRS